MPSFEYEALDASGRATRGVITADTARQARRELRESLLTPVRVSSPRQDSAGRLRRRRDIGSRQLTNATRQLAALLGASTPLEEALNVVALNAETPAVRTRFLAVRERVMEGWRFADALAEHPRSFPALYFAVVAAGETAGDLSGVLERLATMLEKNLSMRNKALGALIYPAALMVIASGVVTALMTQVVPKIVEQFNTFNAELPLVTKIVMTASRLIADYGLLALGGLVLAGLAFWQAMRAPEFRCAFDRWLLNVPVIGRLLRAVDAARFARTLSTLFSGGTPLLNSLEKAARAVGNTYMRRELQDAIQAVSEGASLSSAIKRTGVMPPMMAPMVAAGERSGAVSTMLDKTADQLEEDFDAAAATTLRLLEPTIILALGGVILVIVASILLPILRLNSLAAG